MKFLFDTDHVTIIQDGAGIEFDYLNKRLAAHLGSDLACSIVSFHEQSLGAHTYINRAVDSAGLIRGYKLMDQVASTFTLLPILPFDSDAASVYETLRTRRLRIQSMDLRIAAIALSRDLTLLTRNTSDFGQINDLRTEDWTR